MSKVIKVENLSKAYQLGDFGTGTISRDIERFWARMRGKEDPFLKIGETNDRSKKGSSDIVWSLKDINFELEQGDAVGIIGRNGAGKSTMLKVLSRVTFPTTGSVKVKGRIASLLEVGTGFHPELTGRENIFLNGAILGMRKTEIRRKFDEIVDFSGVERYVDTPVKRYSSGMYVRLAFAVAAHLESEILIIDEVLAVGDAEFQKKCLGKIGEVSQGEGRTVLFVSHNMATIQKICKRGILLKNGTMVALDETNKVIDQYISEKQDITSAYYFDAPADNGVGYIKSVSILDDEDNFAGEIFIGKTWKIKVHFTVLTPVSNFIVAVGMQNLYDLPLRTTWSNPQNYQPGEYIATFTEDKINFTTGRYKLVIGLSIGKHSIQFIDKDVHLNISDVVEQLDESVVTTAGTGIFLNPMDVSIQRL